jgi:hypothetical protein
MQANFEGWFPACHSEGRSGGDKVAACHVSVYDIRKLKVVPREKAVTVNDL